MVLELAKCEKQYKKFPKLDRAEVLKLQEWQNNQPHLPNITELDAIIFLHANEYSFGKAKSCMDTYCTVRTHCPEFFGKRDVNGADITSQMKVSGFIPLEGITNDGYRVVLCKLRDCDASKYNFNDTIKLYVLSRNCLITDLWLSHDGIAEGHAIVIDMEGSSISHLTKVGLISLKKYMFYVQEALPVRVRAFHFINAVSFMDKVLAMMRPFMKKELMDVMHIHTSMDTFLDKHVPKAIMPNEYGGSSGKMEEQIEKIYDELRQNGPFFVDEETKRVNEKLRPGKPKTEGDLFGTEGNFKQLQFD